MTDGIVVKPKMARSVLELSFASLLWLIGVMFSATPSLHTKILWGGLPLLVPFGALFTMGTSAVEVTGNEVVQRIAGIRKHVFQKGDVRNIKKDYLFRNGIKGLGAGMALYVEYDDRDSGRVREMRVGVNLYGKKQVDDLAETLKRAN